MRVRVLGTAGVAHFQHGWMCPQLQFAGKGVGGNACYPYAFWGQQGEVNLEGGGFFAVIDFKPHAQGEPRQGTEGV